MVLKNEKEMKDDPKVIKQREEIFEKYRIITLNKNKPVVWERKGEIKTGKAATWKYETNKKVIDG